VALVVLLKGINVGGHRTFRPSTLARQLRHLGAVNVGAAGTFVIRRPVGRAQLREELSRRLPFDADIVICHGREVVRLLSGDFFSGHAVRPDMVRFVSVLSRSPRSAPTPPMRFPPTGKWLVKVLARENRFVVGLYRRHMKVIGYLGTLDRVFGVPVTTRNWNTLAQIAKVLENGAAESSWREVRSMVFAIKAEVSDPRAETFAFSAQKTMYGGKHIAEGDTVFVIASENEGGPGLIACGVVTSARAIAKKHGVARQTPRVSITIRRTAVAKRRLGRSELRAYSDWNDGRPETELNFKFYRQATNKIVGISDEAAAFLRGFF
jgi:uncharacterized protein (DUF1697 family)